MKILSIDGGGIRGIIPALILSKIEERTGEPISETFDLIAGTSTGGILALGLAAQDLNGNPAYPAMELKNMYENRGKEIFDINIWHSLKSFGNLREEKYPNKGLKKILYEYLGDRRLKDTLTQVMIPSYETERRIPWFFKSKHAKNPQKPSYDFNLVDVALATSAAPTYFEPHKINLKGNDYLSLIDGGVFANNPAMCAFIDATTLFKKKKEDIIMVSLGTGQLTRRLMYNRLRQFGLIQWARPVLSCVFDGVSDTVDYQLSKILNEDQYFRFQTELNTGNDDIDDSSTTNLRALRLKAEEILYNNESKVDKMIDKLCN